ncbi:Glutamate transport membrane-spanning protein [Rubellimicrobium mesophilum DSM 19309]|uniref:Glutamate/aspartate import permease protein GltK n=1 Tax=Rubellimicrobium mesophilum DSM 19309 TaxID=442562 RepID=A0A017HNT5_9RHOB|nr:amino acid ABC transporter permease [Rubellimicrobium mesophilum]EYD76142.1 Glutamate transport membrane-spanning protein [Rubellimicrobium mesophilum DSM 19309]
MGAIILRPGLLRAGGLGLALVLLTALVYATGLGTGWIGERIAALSAALEGHPSAVRLLAAAVVATLLVLNGIALVRLPRSQQVALIWAELGVLVLAFFYSFDLSFEFIWRKIGFLITQGVTTTLLISAASIVIASVLAMVGAIAKLSQSGIAYGLATFYTSLFRGLPLLMQIYIIYLGLPQLGYVVGPVTAGIAALSLCYGAYMTEIFRAGIESIAKGQAEAATALGLSPRQTLWLVVLPQAMRVIIPPTGNQFIAMLKDSSLVSVVGVWELMYLARTQGQTEFRHIEMLITASMIYWALSMGLEFAQARLERRYARSTRR